MNVKMTSKAEVIETVEKLAVILKFYPAKNARENEILIGEYYDALKRYPSMVFQAAIARIKAEDDSFPAISRIQTACIAVIAEICDKLHNTLQGYKNDWYAGIITPKEKWEELRDKYLEIGFNTNAAGIMEAYSYYKDARKPISPEKIAEGKKRLRAIAEGMRME